MSEPTLLTTTYFLQHAIIAVFGGIANAINKHRNGQSKTMLDFILLTIMSSFFGVIFGLLAISFYPTSEYLTMAVAGTGGWLGIESTGIIINIIQKRFK